MQGRFEDFECEKQFVDSLAPIPRGERCSSGKDCQVVVLRSALCQAFSMYLTISSDYIFLIEKSAYCLGVELRY